MLLYGLILAAMSLNLNNLRFVRLVLAVAAFVVEVAKVQVGINMVVVNVIIAMVQEL